MRAFQSQAFARNPRLVDFGALWAPYPRARPTSPRTPRSTPTYGHVVHVMQRQPLRLFGSR